MTDDLVPTFALAYHEAEERKARAELEAAEARRAQEALDAELHVYDPMPYDEAEPVDKMYEGTAIGAMYGLPGPDLEPLLEGWTLAPRTVYE